MNDAAIVTLAIGESHASNWKRYCAPNWLPYADKHQLDLIVLTEPLDDSPQAQARSPAWQKCLVLNQPFVAQYRQVVLLDSDIIINADSSPRITSQVPVERIGGVISGSHLQEDLRVVLLNRLRGRNYPYERGLSHWHNDQQSYYRLYGFLPPTEGIIQTGVLVASPTHHRELFLDVYAAQHQQADRTYEQIPLSYEILRRNVFQALDSRFNSVFFETMLVYYPHLVNQARPDFEQLAKYATRIQYFNSFFLHFAFAAEFMRFVFDETDDSSIPS